MIRIGFPLRDIVKGYYKGFGLRAQNGVSEN